jgi:hypothetical protein
VTKTRVTDPFADAYILSSELSVRVIVWFEYGEISATKSVNVSLKNN